MTTLSHPDTPYRMAMHACLDALIRQLADAQTLAAEARQAMERSEFNLAIGTLLPLKQQLPECEAMLRAVLTLQGWRNRTPSTEGGVP